MKISDRGAKHVCPACTRKYYDLGRDIVTCPQCGAKPPAPKPPRSRAPVRRAGSMAFRRHR